MAKKRVTQGRIVKEDPADTPAPKEKKAEYSIWMWLFLGIATGMLIRIISSFFTSR